MRQAAGGDDPNDALAAAHEAHPHRFFGLAILPMQDRSLALAELERAAKLPGIRGVYMATCVLDRELSDEMFWPVYERLEALTYLIHLVGSGRVLLGSDYCFDMGYEQPVEVVNRHASLTPQQRSAILATNAAQLLRVPLAAEG